MRRKKYWIFMILLMTCRFWAIGQEKCEVLDTIRGRVTDFAEYPLRNAKVDLFYKKTKLATSFSDSDGNFQFITASDDNEHFWVRTSLKSYLKNESYMYVNDDSGTQIILKNDPYYGQVTLYCGLIIPPGTTRFTREQIKNMAH